VRRKKWAVEIEMSNILPVGIPQLGYGCGDLYGGAMHSTSARLLETALDHGVRYFDVARLYGNGTAEEVLGSVISRRREEVVVATKVGILPWSMLHSERVKRKILSAIRGMGSVGRAIVPQSQQATHLTGMFDVHVMRRSVERSLRALRSEYIDILLLHDCTASDASRHDVIDFLCDLKARGIVRSFGTATGFSESIQIASENAFKSFVYQFPSDAANQNAQKFRTTHSGKVVTHSCLRSVLPRLLRILSHSDEHRKIWEMKTGINAADGSQIAAALLANELARDKSDIVLFSTSKAQNLVNSLAASQVVVQNAGDLDATINSLLADAVT
jgi:D-threo-aldose 1-dehydrogenase